MLIVGEKFVLRTEIKEDAQVFGDSLFVLHIIALFMIINYQFTFLQLSIIHIYYNKFNAIDGVWLAVASNVADACCNI